MRNQSKKFIIKDWVGNVCFLGKEFDSFDDAWEFIYETDPNPKEDDHWYDDYFVEKKLSPDRPTQSFF